MNRPGEQRAREGPRRGSVNSASLILITTIVGLGVIAGGATFRDALLMHLGDIAVSMERLDQSYSVTIDGVVHEFVDTPVAETQPIVVTVEATGE